MKKIILSVVTIVVIAVAIGLYQYYKPQKNYAASKPDYELTVSDLFNAFSKDENAANKKFVAKNSTIQVTGLLHDIVHEADSSITLILKAKDNDEASIYCNLVSANLSALDNLKTGSPITVKGQCTGFQGLIDKAVYMIRGTIVEK